MNDKLNKLIDKFELLYNINSQTPLFVTIAYKKIDDDKLDEGLEVLEKGLKDYPNHPTALLLKSKILVKKGNYPQALKLIKNASSLIGHSKTFDFYITELEMLNKSSIKIEPDTQNDLIVNYSSQTKDLSEKPLTPTDETVKTGNMTSTNTNILDDSLIISDTLAKIYFNQKEYKEAIRIYSKLKLKHPEKSEFYDSKIAEIQSLIDNS